VLGATALVAVSGAAAVPAAPMAVMLHLDGTHAVGTEFHQGTFTASPPLCSSGSWLGNGLNTRVFTCSDASGTFTATFNGELEHVAGLDGPWFILGGSGTYMTLRGKGVGKVDTNQGGDTPPVTFSDTWTGVVDFDATAPTGAFTKTTVVRPRVSVRAWSVRVAFTARDNVEANPVAFRASATFGGGSLFKSGTIRTGSASVVFTVRARSARVVRIEISLSDPWGSEAAIKKTVRLR